MTLSQVGTSAPVFTGTDVEPTVPAGTTAGDHAFLLATAKQQTKDFDPATFGAWTLLWSGLLPASSTQGNFTAGQGQVLTGVWYLQVPAGGLTAPVIGLTGSGSNTVASGSISVWRSDTGAAVDTAYAEGDDLGTVTHRSVTANTDPGYTAGDQALLFSVLTNDTDRMSTLAITAPDATFSALTSMFDVGSGTGDDTGVECCVGSVTAGTSTGPPTFTSVMQSGAGHTGGTVFLRIRETGGGPPPPAQGAAADTWTFTGTAAGTAPALTPTTGSASGAWQFTGTAVGSAPTLPPAQGTGEGTWQFTSAATGGSARAGQAAGTWTFTGASAGVSARRGTAAGGWAYTGTAAGSTTKRGTAAGAWRFAGEATGSAPTVGMAEGAAAGTWSFTGATTGARASRAQAAGTVTWSGTAAGQAPVLPIPTGTGTGTWAFVGAAGSVATHLTHSYGYATLAADGTSAARVAYDGQSTAALASDGTSTATLASAVATVTLHTDD